MFAEANDCTITTELGYRFGYQKVFEAKVWTRVDALTQWSRQEHTVSLVKRYLTHNEALEAGVSFARSL
jgi:hypothetical protein